MTVLRRLEQMMEANLDQPLYLAEVCSALGVSERTLRTVCMDLLGMGPQVSPAPTHEPCAPGANSLRTECVDRHEQLPMTMGSRNSGALQVLIEICSENRHRRRCVAPPTTGDTRWQKHYLCLHRSCHS
jgi:AraC-like DNA-binding protein